MEKTIRPTKKQLELLEFIRQFIQRNGYSPSYREIMTGLGYNSVATVALHVNSLISRGHLIKRDRSSRSLELTQAIPGPISTNLVSAAEEKWLVDKVDYFFKEAENAGSQLVYQKIDELEILVGALRVLGLSGAAHSFVPRLAKLKKTG